MIVVRPSAITGTVEAVHRKTISNGKTKHGICIADRWYNLLTRGDVEGLATGAQLSFTATDKGGSLGWCVHPLEFKVTRPAPQVRSTPAEPQLAPQERPPQWTDDGPAFGTFSDEAPF
jgi:hypothetical protein